MRLHCNSPFHGAPELNLYYELDTLSSHYPTGNFTPYPTASAPGRLVEASSIQVRIYCKQRAVGAYS